VLTFVTLVGVAAVPLVISYTGYDHFRLPKQLFLYTVAITTAAIAGIGVLLRRLNVVDEARNMGPILWVASAGFCWLIVTGATSTNRALSMPAMVWVTSLMMLFFVLAFVVRHAPFSSVAAAILIPAVINSVVVVLQAFEVWNPWVFHPHEEPRMMKNALLGNPNDVAVYLVGPALFAFATAFYGRTLRWWYGAVAVLLTAAIVLTETMTCIAAIVCGALLLFMRNGYRQRRTVIAAVILGAIVFAAASFFPPIRNRIDQAASAYEQNQWDQLARGRLMPLKAASKMFIDHPLTGVGPGAFKFQYLPYRIAVGYENPRLARERVSSAVNFGELHNDHMQILAETGIPGLVVSFAAFFLLLRISRRRVPEPTETKARIAEVLALPFGVTLAFIMLAQFPWHLAAPACANIVIAACCFAWSADVA